VKAGVPPLPSGLRLFFCADLSLRRGPAVCGFEECSMDGKGRKRTVHAL
jgi:hypothetical protein